MSAPERKNKRRQDNVTKLNRRLRKEMRSTPWQDVWELESVGRGLLSVLNSQAGEATPSILEALDVTTVWKARSHAMEALPHAVESTAALAQVYWRDQMMMQQMNDRRMCVSVTELRLAYSSAIVRCINGFADALQQQRFVAAPVSILCGQLGIPSWLVDIRHEASHNALPTLPVLRLATVTLLEYLQNEYWIPTCPQWITEKEGNLVEEEQKADQDGTNSPNKPIDILLQYKACASKFQASALVEENLISTTKSDDGASSDRTGTKQLKSTSTKRPFDTFFGDSDGGGSDDDEDEWEDPLLGSLWGSSIGTSNNRFAVLEPPKKIKPSPPKKPKKAKKPKPPQRKKLPGEKYPFDHAKEFVEAVSPQEGFSTAIQFLVWGGIGGAASGRGVLIPGSTVAFPATQQGIRKSWQRYLPLIEVLGRVWPGFCSALLLHLIEFVLSIEESCVAQGSEDPGSVRKLFFLSSWIRLLVSEQFVQKLYPSSTSSSNKGKKGNTTEIPLASCESIQPLGYPLNSLCDRCSFDDNPELHKASRDILQTFEEILGSQRVVDHGIEIAKLSPNARPQRQSSPLLEEPMGEIGHGPALSDGKMSLDEMEAMFSDDEEEAEHDAPSAPDKKPTRQSQELVPNRPTAWIRCKVWDECALGTMPGQPV